MSDTILDPLAMTGDAPDPSFPVLREGVKRLTISSIEKKEFEGKDGKPPSSAVSIKLTTTAEDRDTENNILHPGFAFNVMIFTTPNENTSVAQIKENLSMPVKAAFGRDIAKTKSLNDCLGKVVDCKVGVRAGKGSYGDSNVVKAWIVPGEKK